LSTTVYIMRHGIAEDRAAGGDDADRRLTSEGRKKVVEIAHGLKQLGIKPDVVLASPLPRAMETATLTASVLDRELDVEPETALSTGYDAQSAVAALARCSGVGEVMVVGHQPQLGEIASILLTGSHSIVPLPFKKGGVAAIGIDDIPPRYAGSLLWFMTPKQLRAHS
jgi:phosphohistidine phosphatase